MTHKQLNHIFNIFVSSFFFPIILIFSLFMGSVIMSQLSPTIAKLLPNDTQKGFIELYFNNHQDLPNITTAITDKSISFNIHNLYNGQKDIKYEIRLYNQNSNTLITSGEAVLSYNEKITVYHKFTQLNEQDLVQKSQIIVSLPQYNQYISFWLNPVNSSILHPTQIPSKNKKYGEWYILPESGESAMYMGKDKNGNEMWSTTGFTPTPEHIPVSKN